MRRGPWHEDAPRGILRSTPVSLTAPGGAVVHERRFSAMDTLQPETITDTGNKSDITYQRRDRASHGTVDRLPNSSELPGTLAPTAMRAARRAKRHIARALTEFHGWCIAQPDRRHLSPGSSPGWRCSPGPRRPRTPRSRIRMCAAVITDIGGTHIVTATMCAWCQPPKMCRWT
jgi:hypothetical protein